MATAEQIKALVKSHNEGDDSRFYSVAMQVAAGEAKNGHPEFAAELRALIDQAREKQGLPQPGRTTIPRPGSKSPSRRDSAESTTGAACPSVAQADA